MGARMEAMTIDPNREAWADALYCMKWHQLTSGQQLIVNAALAHAASENDGINDKATIKAMHNSMTMLQSENDALRDQVRVLAEAAKAVIDGIHGYRKDLGVGTIDMAPAFALKEVLTNAKQLGKE